MKIRSTADISSAGKKILERLNAKNVLLTLSEEGIAVFEEHQPERRMPTKAIKVADVSGAGDTVISTLTIALAANANILEACYLANFAAGIVCGEVGIVLDAANTRNPAAVGEWVRARAVRLHHARREEVLVA